LKVGIIGGSGGLGGGLALRLARRDEVIIGSRDEDRAKSMAKELWQMARTKFGALAAGSISGASNLDAVALSDFVVMAVPANSLEGFLQAAKGYAWGGKLVLSPVTRFVREGGAFTYKPFQSGGKTLSAAELVQETLGGGAHVVSGLHCVPADRLANLNDLLGFDVPLAGPKDSVATVAQVLEGIEGLRPLFAGPLAVSSSLEALTPLLLNISVRNNIKEPGFRVVA
jgi:NADPH-dependent F420 reductase